MHRALNQLHRLLFRQGTAQGLLPGHGPPLGPALQECLHTRGFAPGGGSHHPGDNQPVSLGVNDPELGRLAVPKGPRGFRPGDSAVGITGEGAWKGRELRVC